MFCWGLRNNEGPKWSPLVWEKTTGTKRGEHFQNEYEKRETKVITNNISKRKPENKLKRWKRKLKSANESNNKKARLEYGPNTRDIDLDVSTEELNEKINQVLEKKINISSKEIN